MRLFLVAAALACVVAPAVAAPGSLTGKWRIVAVNGVQALEASSAHAEFARNGRFASTVGCNRIAGTPAISGAKLSFGPLMATRMACPPPLDHIEQSYLAALAAVRSYSVEGGRLAFLGEGGEALVTLEKEPSSGGR